MKTHVVGVVLCLLAMGGVSSAPAQKTAWERVREISAQRKIKVYLSNGDQIEGRFVEANAESATLLVKGGKTVRIGKEEVQRITHGIGKGRAALIGLGVGAGVAVAIVAANPNHCLACDSGAGGSAQQAAAGGIVFGGLGAAVGGLIGREQTIYKGIPTAYSSGSRHGLEASDFDVVVEASRVVVQFTLKNVSGNTIQFGQDGVFVGCRKGEAACDFGNTGRGSTLASGATVSVKAEFSAKPPREKFTLWPGYQVNSGEYGPDRWNAKTITVPGSGDGQGGKN
jgi:hypothetical protein